MYVRKPCLFAGCLGNDSRESFRVSHSDVGQHLAVKLDVCNLHCVDQAAVGSAVEASGRVDAADPQPAKISSSGAAIAVGIPQAFQHCLIGSAEKLALGAVLTLGKL